MQGSEAEDAARAVTSAVKEAVARVDDGVARRAADLLLGISRTRGLPRKDRRKHAADALVLSEVHFRKRRELTLLREVAEEIRAMETGCSGQVVPGVRASKEASGDQQGKTQPADASGSPIRAARAHRGARRAVIGLIILAVVAALVLVSRSLFPPAPVDDLVVTRDLVIEPQSPRVGDLVTATSAVDRERTGPEAVVQIEAGGREDVTGDACQRADQAQSWNGGGFADFRGLQTRALAPGRGLTYRRVRTFDKPGRYFAEPVKQTEDGRWGGIPNAKRVCFSVRP